jgi:cytochrome c-type biogenesis protein CcmH
MSSRARHLLPVAALLVAVAVAVGGVLAARSRPASLDSRVDAVAGTLRCPTCTAESVADSNSAMAQSMRHQIRHQLSRGRSPDQIRSWFESRYGERVLLMPHPRGLALLLWVVPVGAVVGGVLLLFWSRRRSAADPPHRAAVLSPRRVGVAALVCVVVGAGIPALAWARTRPADASAAATRPMRAQDWVAVAQSLDQQQDYRSAVEAYRHAFQQRPDANGVRTGLAFDLVRSGRPRQAIRLVARLAHHSGPHQPLGTLILGLAQRAAGLPSATSTLRDFLRLAPHHPAAAQVRRLLSGSR